jgi:hypothetical protein
MIPCLTMYCKYQLFYSLNVRVDPWPGQQKLPRKVGCVLFRLATVTSYLRSSIALLSDAFVYSAYSIATFVVAPERKGSYGKRPCLTSITILVALHRCGYACPKMRTMCFCSEVRTSRMARSPVTLSALEEESDTLIRREPYCRTDPLVGTTLK